MKGIDMRKGRSTVREPRMLREYDFSGGMRGKYARRFAAGSNVVVLAPDVARRFKDSRAVNRALRSLVGGAARVKKRASG